MSEKVVRFRKELDKTNSKKAKSTATQRKKSDIAVDKYCADNPLTLPTGVEVHRLFFDKGQKLPSDLDRLFSDGVPKKGYTSLKSILYNHVLAPTQGMQRREMFTNLSDSEIYSLKDDIVSLIDDPFWKQIESQQKFGSYDWHGYGSLISNISGQYRTHGDDTIPDWLEYGIRAAVNELPDGIEPIGLEEAISYCKTDTNSGFPAFTSKPFIKLNEDGSSYTILDPELYSIYTHIAKSVWDGKAHHNLPAVLFKRIQPGEGATSKTRIVECVSRGVLWAEARIWRPILEAMRGIPAYFGYMHHSNGLRDLIQEALERDHVSSLDYSAYDALVGRCLRLLFSALADKIPSAAPLLSWSGEYYRTCPLLTPHGWIQGEHGLFSGMFGTSFGGSLINRGLILGMEYAAQRDGVDIRDSVHAGFGDDTIYAWNGTAQIGDVLGYLRSAGMELNDSKQEYCGPTDAQKFVMFQACYWRRNIGSPDHCVPVYPLVRCAARLAFIEYMDPYTKLIKSAGLKIDGIECPEVVGPILCAVIAKLMECEYHPSLEVFINTFQGVWMHYLNPLACISSTGILQYIRSEFSYMDSTEVPKFLEHPVCRILLEGVKRMDMIERTEYTLASIKRLADERLTNRPSRSHNVEEESETDSELIARMIEDAGFSEGLIQSIFARIPEEALY